MKKFALLMFVVILTLVAAGSWARQWNASWINPEPSPYFCNESPSIALLYGVQPIVSNANMVYGEMGSVVHQTAFGWERYTIAQGYIAGDGWTDIRSFQAPISYGQDGNFYSAVQGPNGVRPTMPNGSDGPIWPYINGVFYVTADSTGAVYMASEQTVARTTGASWSQPVELGTHITDLAVSRYGDIAVGGVSLDGMCRTVQWFDYKLGRWCSRSLAGTGSRGKVDVEWDSNGNLGVAYTDTDRAAVKFDYLDMSKGSWTTETVRVDNNQLFTGAALAYDRFDNPVIASGEYLFYDPVSVPEPSCVVVLLGGLCGLAWRRKK